MILRLLHRYIAFAGLLVFVAVGLSGSLLVFRAELEHLLNPERALGTAASEGPRYQMLLDVARKVAPGADAWAINPPADPSMAVQVRTEGPHEELIFLHPITGKVISTGAVSDYPVDWLWEMHVDLLAGSAGHAVVFVAGLALIGMFFSGIALWWPRTIRAALRYRLDLRGLPFQVELHRLAGIIGGPALGVAAITGVLLLYPEPVMKAVTSLSGVGVSKRAIPAAPGHLPADLDLDRIVASANQALPGSRVTRVIVPANGGPIVVRKKAEGEMHPNGLSLVTVDPATGTVLSAVASEDASASIRMWEWVYPMHRGALFGAANKILVLVAGLLPIVMGITGLLIWWSRRRAQRARVSSFGARAG